MTDGMEGLDSHVAIGFCEAKELHQYCMKANDACTNREMALIYFALVLSDEMCGNQIRDFLQSLSIHAIGECTSVLVISFLAII